MAKNQTISDPSYSIDLPLVTHCQVNPLIDSRTGSSREYSSLVVSGDTALTIGHSSVTPVSYTSTYP